MTSTVAASVFRDYVTDGVPASGPNPVSKADIRALFDGILTNAPRSVSVPYTVDPNADPGATIVATGRGTLTFNAASGYAGTHINLIFNTGTRRIIVAPSGGPSVKLYPGQFCIVANVSGAWVSTPAHRYALAGVALNADALLGDDTAGDGLASGSGGAYLTLARVITALYQDFDLSNGNATITAAGAFTESVTIQGQPTGYNVFDLVGSAGFTWHAGSLGYCAIIADNAEVELSNCTLDSGGVSGRTGISGHQNMVLDFLGGNAFGSFAGGTHIQSDHGPSVFNFSNAYTVSGPANTHMQWGSGASVSHAGGITVTLSGSPTIGLWLKMVAAQMIFAGAVAYSGSLPAGCQQFSVDFNSVLVLSGTTLPGSISGSSAHGSQVL